MGTTKQTFAKRLKETAVNPNVSFEEMQQHSANLASTKPQIAVEEKEEEYLAEPQINYDSVQELPVQTEEMIPLSKVDDYIDKKLAEFKS
jgi:hypothetical protein